MDSLIDELLFVAKNAALIGGNILKENFGKVKDSDIIEKKEKDFVSFVDKASENAIVEYISYVFKDHVIIGEEGSRQNSSLSSPFKWFIDPLDGTKNYINGFCFFATSVGVLYKDEPIVGAVYFPYFNDIYYAAKGRGAYKNGERIKVSSTDSLKLSSVVYGFPSRSKRDLNLYLSISKDIFIDVASMRRPGAAACDLCMVAEGIFEGLIEFELNPWDIAAGCVILKEAGGTFTLSNGFNERTDIIASNSKLQSYLENVYKFYIEES